MSLAGHQIRKSKKRTWHKLGSDTTAEHFGRQREEQSWAGSVRPSEMCSFPVGDTGPQGCWQKGLEGIE